jgi:predicted transcriptional regulator
MSVTIKVDKRTAALLRARAAQCRMTVPEFGDERVAADAETITELDRRRGRVAAGGRVLAHSEVVRWLRTWGTSHFRPWSSRGV